MLEFHQMSPEIGNSSFLWIKIINSQHEEYSMKYDANK